MNELHVLFKFANNPYGGVEIDTTSNSGQYRELSPFVLGPIDTYIRGVQAKNFENLWQFSKVYQEHVTDNVINASWYRWRNKGWSDPKAHRYPMGKGRRPLFSYWARGERLGYIEARKKIYAPIYARYVICTEAFARLAFLYNFGTETIVLRDYDAYDHIAEGLSLVDVINDPGRKCGHAFVLAMILTGVLSECLNEVGNEER